MYIFTKGFVFNSFFQNPHKVKNKIKHLIVLNKLLDTIFSQLDNFLRINFLIFFQKLII